MTERTISPDYEGLTQQELSVIIYGNDIVPISQANSYRKAIETIQGPIGWSVLDYSRHKNYPCFPSSLRDILRSQGEYPLLEKLLPDQALFFFSGTLGQLAQVRATAAAEAKKPESVTHGPVIARRRI